MKRSLLMAALSALLLALFALPLAAEQIVPVEGEATPDEEILPPAFTVTPYQACIVEALDPTSCDHVPVTLPVASCPPEGCGAVGAVPEEPQANQAALTAAEGAASEAVADIIAEEGPDAVDSTATYLAALGAAREAARVAGADEGVAETLAETAAIGAVAREAASDAIAGDPGGAVDGAASYIEALGAAREAGASEESAPTPADRAVTTRSGEKAPDGKEARSSGAETGDSRDQVAKDEASSVAGSATSGDEASFAGGGASTSATEEEPFEAVVTALPAARSASPVVLGAGALLLVAGVVGLLIRRRLTSPGSHAPEDQQHGEEDTVEETSTVRRLTQRFVQ